MSTRTLTTTLPSGTLYVSGTVNGVSTTWTNTEGNTWETVAERSPQDVYVVAPPIINQIGNATETTFTLYYGLHLVTDRTQADVIAGNEKGIYKASDLNRVGTALITVHDRLRTHGIDVPADVREDYAADEVLDKAVMNAYIESANAVHDAVENSAPQPPAGIDGLDWEGANNIERAIIAVDDVLESREIGWIYADAELYAGDMEEIT